MSRFHPQESHGNQFGQAPRCHLKLSSSRFFSSIAGEKVVNLVINTLTIKQQHGAILCLLHSPHRTLTITNMLFDRGISSEMVMNPFGYSSTLSLVEAASSGTDEIILAFEACLDFCIMFIILDNCSINKISCSVGFKNIGLKLLTLLLDRDTEALRKPRGFQS